VGWCVGCNPPFVDCGIRLIGLPALSCREVTSACLLFPLAGLHSDSTCIPCYTLDAVTIWDTLGHFKTFGDGKRRRKSPFHNQNTEQSPKHKQLVPIGGIVEKSQLERTRQERTSRIFSSPRTAFQLLATTSTTTTQTQTTPEHKTQQAQKPQRRSSA